MKYDDYENLHKVIDSEMLQLRDIYYSFIAILRPREIKVARSCPAWDDHVATLAP